MNKSKKENDTIIVVALIVSIICLSIAFAAYTKTLKISKDLTVKANQATFGVKISSDPNGVYSNKIVPETYNGALGEEAVIDEKDGAIIRNIRAHFTRSGQKVNYKFYIRNTGEFKANLTNIIFNYVTSTNVKKVCIAQQAIDLDLLDSICDDINVYVSVNGFVATNSITDIKNSVLDVGYSNEVNVTIEYTKGIDSPVPLIIDFGDIYLKYE